MGLSALMLLTACGGGPDLQPENVGRTSGQIERAERGSLLGGDGLVFSTRDRDSGGQATGIGVNSYLWRASLDTVSFMPVASADPFGGTILTDWYSPPDTPGERFKVNVYILDRDLRSDGVRVSVFRQEQDDTGNWRDATVSGETAREMENAILTRARQMRVGQTAER